MHVDVEVFYTINFYVFFHSSQLQYIALSREASDHIY